jgi:hypothetical protein
VCVACSWAYLDAAALEVPVVEVLDGIVGVALLGEGHEGEAPGAAVLVHGDEHVRELSKSSELVVQVSFLSAERQVAHVELGGLHIAALIATTAAAAAA